MKPLTARKQLIVIASMFILPVIVAGLMSKGVIDLVPKSRTNRGILVQPPLPITWTEELKEDLGGRWVLAAPLNNRCNDECEHRLTGLRQLHLALGREQTEVRILLITPDTDPVINMNSSNQNDSLLAIYPHFVIARDRNREFTSPLLKARSMAVETDPDSAEGIYLIDPQSRIMMYYHPNTDPNDIKSDLKRLLKQL